MMMARSFSWGIIGTGGIASAFATDVQHLSDQKIRAVGSRSIQSGRRFASQFPDCIAYASYEELVADPEIDGVYVATPNTLHLSNTLLALSAGKPVLCEKPFAVSAIEVKQMMQTAAEKKLTLMEAMWTRFLPHMKKAMEIVMTGEIGQVSTIEADHGQRLAHLQIPRLMRPELAGGALLDLGIYPVSLAHMFLGVPETITASSIFTKDGVDGQTSAIFNYASGAQAILSANMNALTPCRAVITGTLGRIEIDSVFYRPATMRVVHIDDSVIEYPNNYAGMGLREEAIEFARLVQAGELESPLLTLAHSYEVMQSMDQIRKIIKLKYPFE